MKKTLLVLAVAAALLIGAAGLAACDLFGGKNPPSPPVDNHTCVWSLWEEFDSVRHVSYCMAGCGGENFEDHDFSNGNCVCGLKPHVHTPSSEWQYDSAHHWHYCESYDYCPDSPDRKIDCAPHDYTYGDCICGLSDFSGFCYALNEDGESYCVSAPYTDAFTLYKKAEIRAEDFRTEYNGKPVTSIGDAAFYGNVKLKTITIPQNITAIGEMAFERSGLTGITLPETVLSIGGQAFCECSSLKSAVINATLCDFGIFYGCPLLEQIEIGENATEIETESFYGCEKLESITVSDENRVYASDGGILYNKAKTEIIYVPRAIKGDVTICSGVTAIGYISEGYSLVGYAFYGCNNVTSITLPGSVQTIGGYAFGDCSSLKTVSIGYGVTEIGDSAFGPYARYCPKLESITVDGNNMSYASADGILYNKAKTQFVYIPYALKGEITVPEGINSISSNEFYDRVNLTGVTLPQSLHYIGEKAFSRCVNLRSISIGAGVTSIGSDAFYGCAKSESITVASANTVYRGAGNCLIKTASKELVLGCKNSVIPADDSVRTIGNYAFSGCDGLISIVLPDSVRTIGNFAFNGCISLESVSVPDSINFIAGEAFYGCGNLQFNEYGEALYLGNSANPYAALIKSVSKDITSLTVHPGAKIIAGEAFYGCENLESVTIPGGVTAINGGAFYNCPIKNATVPACVANAVSNSALETAVIVCGGAIAESAFSGCENLTSVTLPEDLTSISREMLYGCTNLESITIPDTVTYIGLDAFGNSGITDIYFQGTKAQWEAITKYLWHDAGWDAHMGDYTVHCIDD